MSWLLLLLLSRYPFLSRDALSGLANTISSNANNFTEVSSYGIQRDCHQTQNSHLHVIHAVVPTGARDFM